MKVLSMLGYLLWEGVRREVEWNKTQQPTKTYIVCWLDPIVECKTLVFFSTVNIIYMLLHIYLHLTYPSCFPLPLARQTTMNPCTLTPCKVLDISHHISIRNKPTHIISWSKKHRSNVVRHKRITHVKPSNHSAAAKGSEISEHTMHKSIIKALNKCVHNFPDL